MSLSESNPEDLLGLTEALVNIPSVSKSEQAIADEVEQFLSTHAPYLDQTRIGNSVVARSNFGLPIRVVLAGHLDTVPASEGQEVRNEGETLYGVGSSDMKSGLAVMLYLSSMAREFGADTSFVFYETEEIADKHNGLRRIFSEQPQLAHGEFAILLEPTANVLEAGCQGSATIQAEFVGERSHTARPWVGENAIHKLADPIKKISQYARSVLIDGLEFTESMQVVGIEGGIANNVVPDLVTIKINHRFAPDRNVEEAQKDLAELLGAERIEVLSELPGAMPALSNPLVAQFAGSLDLAVKPKLAWTDVARFASVGIPAVNLGPGDPQFAHRADEQVAKADIETCARLLTYYLGNVLKSPIRAE